MDGQRQAIADERQARSTSGRARRCRADFCAGWPTVDVANLASSDGITQLALPWALGGYEYGGSINQIFNGWGGDVRIVNRALPVSEFMINK